jgi:hypothetical protein
LRTILLDSSAVLRQPSTLSYSAPDTHLVMPAAVLVELGRISSSAGSPAASLPALIKSAQVAGTVQVLEPSKPWVFGPGVGPPKADMDLLRLAQDLNQQQGAGEVLIASDDRDIESASANLGIRTISGEELAKLLSASGKPQEGLREQASSVARFQTRHLAYSAAAGVLATLVLNFAYSHRTAILDTFPVWGTLLVVLALAVLLYWARSRQRLAYGIGELLVGFLGVVRVVIPHLQPMQLGTSEGLQAMAGLYVMVRGLDNIGTGLQGTRWQGRWRRAFPT